MKLLVMGASGGVGRELVKQGLAQEQEITAFVKPRTTFLPARAGSRAMRSMTPPWARPSRVTMPCSTRSAARRCGSAPGRNLTPRGTSCKG